MLINFIRVVHPSVVVVTGILLTGLSVAKRLLLSTPIGLLFLSFTIYWLAEPIAGVDPLSLGDLVLWVDSLSPGAAGIFWTSLVAFFGIFGGLSTGAWILRAQQRDRLKEMAASEVGEVLTRVKASILEIDTEADGVLRCLDKLRQAEDGADEKYWAEKLLKNFQSIRAETKNLMKLQRELGFCFDLHLHVFDSEYLLTGIREALVDSINLIVHRCFFAVPLVNPENSQEREFMLEHGDWEKCRELERACADFGPVVYGLLIPLRAVTTSSFPTPFAKWAQDAINLRASYRNISSFRKSLRKLEGVRKQKSEEGSGM